MEMNKMRKKKEEMELPKALQKDYKKKNKKRKIKKIIIVIIIILLLGISTLAFLLYGPYPGFREWLITTAMTTMSHQYLATWFYDDATIQEVLNRNKVQEVNEITDTNTIVVDNTDRTEYANEYERQILEKDPNNDDYKIIEIKGKGYSGYMAVIYDPSRIKTVYTKKLGTSGQYLTTMAKDNEHYRRVVPSPDPKRILGLSALQTLIDSEHLIICCGGGGIPVYFRNSGELVGAEAVIDKDLASSLLAASLKADLFIIATDVKGIFLNWEQSNQKLIRQTSPAFLRQQKFATGSMGPKVEAACRFVEKTGRTAVVGSLEEIEDLAVGLAGTRIGTNFETVFSVND